MKGRIMADETQTSLTAGEAAKLVGKSVPTITRAIKSGKLNAKPRKPRGWIIEPSELFRAFDAVTSETNSNSAMLEDETRTKDIVLQVKLEAMEQRFEDAEKTIEDLRTRLDKSESARERQDMILADMRKAPKPAPKRGFWARLVG